MASIIANASRAALKRTVAPSTSAAAFRAPVRFSSTMHDNDPEVLEREKRRNMSKEQHKTSTPYEDGAPGWNEHLASASEAAVKSDRHSDSTKNLQEQTITYVKKRHVEADSPGAKSAPPNTGSNSTQEPGVSTSRMSHGDVGEAKYAKDEIDGPLKGAQAS